MLRLIPHKITITFVKRVTEVVLGWTISYFFCSSKRRFRWLIAVLHLSFKNSYIMPVTYYNLYSLTFYYSSIDIIRPPLKRDFYLVKNGNVIWWFDLFRLKLYKLFPLMILSSTFYQNIHDFVFLNMLIGWGHHNSIFLPHIIHYKKCV